MRSLRRTLALGTIGGIALVLLVAGTVVYVLVRGDMVRQFDGALVDEARLLASTVERESGEVELEFDELDMGEFRDPGGPGYLQLWVSDGPVLYRSGSLGEHDMERAADSATGPPLFRWVTLPNGHTARAVELTFRPRLDEDDDDGGRPARRISAKAVTLILGRDAESVHAALDTLRAVLLGVGLVGIAISSGVLWVVVTRSLAPLNRVAERIGRIGDRNLTERIRSDGVPRELRGVVDRLNELLARLDAAFRRERSFSADVAHELRTPLAGLRSTMEVAVSKVRQGGEYREAIGDCLRMVLRMQAMVETLLSLVRLEAGQVQIRPEPIVPDELVRSAWAALEEEARRRKLQVRWSQSATRPVRTDPTLLGLVVGNILENAVVYTDEGGTVEIESRPEDSGLRIRVTNSGSRIPRDQAEMVFERFWRGDAARSEAGVRCGLGLSLVRKAVSVLGGSVEVESGAGGRFEITVSIPDLGPPGGA